MSEIVALRCDGPGCDVISMPWEARVKAKPSPGKTRRDRLHYCADHYPYQQCHVCSKNLRPYQAQAKDWPNTVAKQRSNPPMCSSCAKSGVWKIDTKADVDQETAAKVRRLVMRHYQQEMGADDWLLPAEETLMQLGLD